MRPLGCLPKELWSVKYPFYQTSLTVGMTLLTFSPLKTDARGRPEGAEIVDIAGGNPSPGWWWRDQGRRRQRSVHVVRREPSRGNRPGVCWRKESMFRSKRRGQAYGESTPLSFQGPSNKPSGLCLGTGRPAAFPWVGTVFGHLAKRQFSTS